ncbi:MAG: Phosphoribosyl 1,2-cyclic phosphodiesterase [Candidatus Anoxychlamydiales bacterium]|nr:Phosphoribosyl 1,2-cyclic phosphodiesterase [Candidatus Anoxychlamydiales bacterium]
MAKLIFLGTGASSGVPEIGCKCNVCSSSSKFNKRLRPSCLIKIDNKNILIDPGPDFRLQALDHNIEHIDAILITHIHYDHIAGLDDLRALNRLQHSKIKCYLSKDSYLEVKKRFNYLFENHNTLIESAKFDFHILEESSGDFKIDGINFSYFRYYQNKQHDVLGYRVNDLAYITDIKIFKDDIYDFLKNLNFLILSCLRFKESPVHFHVKQAKDFAKKVNAKTTYLTHMAHEIDYDTLKKELNDKIQPAYDNLEINF